LATLSKNSELTVEYSVSSFVSILIITEKKNATVATIFRVLG